MDTYIIYVHIYIYLHRILFDSSIKYYMYESLEIEKIDNITIFSNFIFVGWVGRKKYKLAVMHWQSLKAINIDYNDT